MKANKTVSIFVLILTVVLIVMYIKNNFHLFKDLRIIKPGYLIVFPIFLLIQYFLISKQTQIILRHLNVNLKNKEIYQLSIVTGFYNLITPFKGGMASRAVYLKKRYNFSYTNFLATLSASYVIAFLISSLIGLITAYLTYLQTKAFNLIISLIFLITFMVMMSIILFSPNIKETKNDFLNKFIRVLTGWNIIKKDKKLILKTCIIFLFELLITSLVFYLQFKVFGWNIGFIGALFLSSISYIGILISITPAGLGISEAITVFSALTLGISPVQSLSVALLGRTISIVVLFILGPIFTYKLMKNENNTKE